MFLVNPLYDEGATVLACRSSAMVQLGGRRDSGMLNHSDPLNVTETESSTRCSRVREEVDCVS